MKKLLPVLMSLSVAAAAQARTLETDVTLEADTDWSDEELVIPAGVNLDLNGHKLTVASVSGAGAIRDGRKYVALDHVASTGEQLVNTRYVPAVEVVAAADVGTVEYGGAGKALSLSAVTEKIPTGLLLIIRGERPAR